jgi:type I restriction enzyme S subunit
MKYVNVPSELKNSDIISENFCFSPGRYSQFIPPKQKKGSYFVPLDKLIVLRDTKTKRKNDEWYYYAEIGDIDVSTGGISFKKLMGYSLPLKNPSITKLGDILISTVRTYRKGIGYVSSDMKNLVTTNAVLIIKEVTETVPDLTKLYVYSFLRTDFFVEQVWSMLNRGLYPRVDKGALDKIIIPIPKDPKVIQFVSSLMEAKVDKEVTIRQRHEKILSLIDKEIQEKNKGLEYKYSHPSTEDIKVSSRFDTGLYCKGFQSFKHLIDNYEHGSTCLSDMGIKSRRGQNLAVSVIGKSLYSDVEKSNWYELIRPVNISEYGTLLKREWLGTKRDIPIINEGDIILGCEGFKKGRSIIILEARNKCITNFHGTILFWPDANIWNKIFIRCYLAYLREKGVIDWVGVGGSGGHMSPEYFDYLPIPSVPEKKQKEIAKLYHNHVPAPKKKLNLANFVEWHREWNKELGIWELDKEIRELEGVLFETQEKIIQGKKVKIPFK